MVPRRGPDHQDDRDRRPLRSGRRGDPRRAAHRTGLSARRHRRALLPRRRLNGVRGAPGRTPSRGWVTSSFPWRESTRAGRRTHAGAMSPRYGLVIGAAMASLAAVALAGVPVSWLEAMLDTAGGEATTFLVRRYAASATAAL